MFPDGGGWVELEGFIELNRILRKDMDFHSSSPEASSTSAAGTFMDVGVGDAMDGAVPGHDGEKIDGNGANGAGDDGGDGWGDARDSSIQWQVLEATETAKDTMWQQMTDPETGTVYFYSGTRGLLGGESAWAIPFQVGWTSHVQEDTGYVYFANDSNGEVSWTRPEKPGEMVVVDAGDGGDGGDAAALPGGVFDRYVEYVYIIFSVATHINTEKYNASH